MSEKDLIDIIIKLVGTSIPGYIAYLTLYRLNMITINRQRSDENKIILAILSGINCFVGLSLLQNFESHNFLGNTFWITICLTFFSLFFYPAVFPIAQECYRSFLNKLRKNHDFGEIYHLSRYKQVFDKNGQMWVAIFDFSGQCIVNGKVEFIPDDIEFEYFDMIFSSILENPENWTESEIIERYCENEKEGIGTYKVYVDLEKKIKIHSFRYIENE